MALPKQLRQFYRTIHTNLPHLTKPQAKALALWSFAIIHTGTCGLTTIATYNALLLRQSQNTLRQRLREFYKDAAHKAGAQRRALDITPCFAALLRWIVRLWTPQHKCLALALDATTLKQRFTVLSISVLYHQRALPVAWTIVPATQPGSWRPYWEALLDALRDAIPKAWTVLVCADRGLMPRGCLSGLCSWAGIRFCASTRRAGIGRRGKRPIVAWRRWCRRQACSGAVGWSVSRTTRWRVPCWRIGTQGSRRRG
jgi:hypothetical protein